MLESDGLSHEGSARTILSMFIFFYVKYWDFFYVNYSTSCSRGI